MSMTINCYQCKSTVKGDFLKICIIRPTKVEEYNICSLECAKTFLTIFTELKGDVGKEETKIVQATSLSNNLSNKKDDVISYIMPLRTSSTSKLFMWLEKKLYELEQKEKLTYNITLEPNSQVYWIKKGKNFNDADKNVINGWFEWVKSRIKT